MLQQRRHALFHLVSGFHHLFMYTLMIEDVSATAHFHATELVTPQICPCLGVFELPPPDALGFIISHSGRSPTIANNT